MTDFEKSLLDIDYIIMRDKVIKNLIDYDKFYSYYDMKQVRKLVRLLYNILEK